MLEPAVPFTVSDVHCQLFDVQGSERRPVPSRILLSKVQEPRAKFRVPEARCEWTSMGQVRSPPKLCTSHCAAPSSLAVLPTQNSRPE